MSKFLAGMGATCIHCKNYLLAMAMTENPKHFWNPGMQYICTCKQSIIWTNSIRNVKNFIEFTEGRSDRYHNGFCNDLFCGKCFGYYVPLKNGYPFEGRRLDLFGCEKCQENRTAINLNNFHPTDDYLRKWYTRHLTELKNFL